MTVFIILLALALVCAGVVFGAWLIDGCWRERTRREARDAQLNAQWRALQAANRINLAFWAARQALHQEADRHGQDR